MAAEAVAVCLSLDLHPQQPQAPQPALQEAAAAAAEAVAVCLSLDLHLLLPALSLALSEAAAAAAVAAAVAVCLSRGLFAAFCARCDDCRPSLVRSIAQLPRTGTTARASPFRNVSLISVHSAIAARRPPSPPGFLVWAWTRRLRAASCGAPGQQLSQRSTLGVAARLQGAGGRRQT